MLAVIDYDVENLEPPILTEEEAVERSSLFGVPPTLYPKQVGDLSKGMDEADHKIFSSEVFFFSHSIRPKENPLILKAHLQP